MIKLALIGDSAVHHYTVAERLWELLSVVTDMRFAFSVVPLRGQDDVRAFYQAFTQDPDFKGFNIAAPFKGILAGQVERHEKLVDVPIINTVYKNRAGVIVGVNTDPMAAQKALETQANLYKAGSALVIGSNGTGLPIAANLSRNLNIPTFLYDACSQGQEPPHLGVTPVWSLAEVGERQYDIIINATPLGRYYFDRKIEAFSAPLDFDILERITHPKTVIQETNYLPGNTLLLQMARRLSLPIVTGDLMLVFRAAETLRRYFGVSLNKSQLKMVVSEVDSYIAEREHNVLHHNGHATLS